MDGQPLDLLKVVRSVPHFTCFVATDRIGHVRCLKNDNNKLK